MTSPAGSLLLLGRNETHFPSLARCVAERIDNDELVILPTASAFVGPQAVLDGIGAWLEATGVATEGLHVLTRSDANDPERADRVRQARAVMVTDGNALHLRTTLKETLVLGALVAAVDAGATLIAAGVAASVMSDPMIDPRGGAPTTGLGPLRSFCVADASDHEMLQRTLGLVPPQLAVVSMAPGSGCWCGADGAVVPVGAGEVIASRTRNAEQVDLSTLGPWWEEPN